MSSILQVASETFYLPQNQDSIHVGFLPSGWKRGVKDVMTQAVLHSHSGFSGAVLYSLQNSCQPTSFSLILTTTVQLSIQSTVTVHQHHTRCSVNSAEMEQGGTSGARSQLLMFPFNRNLLPFPMLCRLTRACFTPPLAKSFVSKRLHRPICLL